MISIILHKYKVNCIFSCFPNNVVCLNENNPICLMQMGGGQLFEFLLLPLFPLLLPLFLFALFPLFDLLFDLSSFFFFS